MTEPKGIPIYADDTEYVFSDSVAEVSGPEHMQPSNVAARKLYRCIECMRDISEVLEAAHLAKAKDKRRRRMKLLFTPLFSLVGSLVDLLHDIQTNPDTKRGLPPETAALAGRLEDRLKKNVPFGSSQTLREVRNKMSAHVDKNLHPFEAQKLLAGVETWHVGWWLHCCLTVLADLLKLPIYQWSCESRFPDCVGIFSPDGPFLTVFALDGTKLSHIAGCFIVSDPRKRIFDLLREVVEQSRWMFREGDPQIQGYQEDEPGTSWARSLETLPETGWKP